MRARAARSTRADRGHGALVRVEACGGERPIAEPSRDARQSFGAATRGCRARIRVRKKCSEKVRHIAEATSRWCSMCECDRAHLNLRSGPSSADSRRSASVWPRLCSRSRTVPWPRALQARDQRPRRQAPRATPRRQAPRATRRPWRPWPCTPRRRRFPTNGSSTARADRRRCGRSKASPRQNSSSNRGSAMPSS